MEEMPPAQRRPRNPRTPFSAPEQPAPADDAAARAPRRPGKAAPAVTFQPPADDNPQPASGTGTEPPQAEPARRPQQTPRATAPAKRTKPAAASRTPAESAPSQATTEVGEVLIPEQPKQTSTPARKSTVAKRAPRKATPPRATPEAPPATEQTISNTAEPTRDTAEPTRDTAADGAGAEEAVEAPAAREPAPPASPAAGDGRTDAWAKIVADPGHSPELLALAAVQTIGPRAKEWAARIAAAYPGATAAGKARLAARQFTRFGSLSSVLAALSGSYAPVVLLGTTALTHADLVLHIAAAHGFDPTDEQRVLDLLVLSKVHPSRAEAVAALAMAKRPAYEEEDGGIADAVWRLGRMLAVQAGSWAVVRTVDRVLPGTSLLTAVLTSRSSAQAVAARAHRFYSQESQAFGSTV